MKQTSKRLKWAVLFVLVLVAGVLIILTPARRLLLDWRIDLAETYLRGLANPAQPLPTTISRGTPTNTQSPKSTPIQSPTTLPPVSTPQQSNTPTLQPTQLPEQISLTSPVFEFQDWNNCGPAALAMYLNYYDWQGDQFSISEEIKPQRDDRNVNIDELAYYVRTQAGWLLSEYRVGGNIDLLRSLINAGIPVIVEVTFHFEDKYWLNDDLWAAHYLLLTGYDDTKQHFTTQNSFIGPDLHETYITLDADWEPFNRAYLLVFPTNRSQEVHDLINDNWQVDQNRQNAMEIALLETEANPQNAFAWFNLGSNLVYFEDYIQAATAYDTARNIGLPQRMLRYQFGPFLAYFHAGRTDELLTLTEYALDRTPNSEEALLWQGWGLYRLGDRTGAEESFQKALEAHPNYADAEYALSFLSDN